MMDKVKDGDSTSDARHLSAHESSSSASQVGKPIRSTPLATRSLASRLHRSRKGFALGKSHLSLKLDADDITKGEGTSLTGQLTPASTSSSCSSDVVPWWEVEYQCPPPGHLGAHMVPVSAEEQTVDSPAAVEPAIGTSSKTKSAEANRTCAVSVELSTPTQTLPTASSNMIRPGVALYETPERARRGRHSKLSAILASAPRLLVDSSPSQKRKMRPQDPTDCETDLFYSPVTKELKRSHDSSLKKTALPSRVVTPSTLVQPLTQIGISETRGPQLATKPLDNERLAP